MGYTMPLDTKPTHTIKNTNNSSAFTENFEIIEKSKEKKINISEFELTNDYSNNESCKSESEKSINDQSHEMNPSSTSTAKLSINQTEKKDIDQFIKLIELLTCNEHFESFFKFTISDYLVDRYKFEQKILQL